MTKMLYTARSRAMDARIAEEVMGYVWVRAKAAHGDDTIYRFLRSPRSWSARNLPPAIGDEPLADGWEYDIPHYLGALGVTWNIVDHLMKHRGLHFEVHWDFNKWNAAFYESNTDEYAEFEEVYSSGVLFKTVGEGKSKDVREAICLAALDVE